MCLRFGLVGDVGVQKVDVGVMIVYLITNRVNGKGYVGITTRTLEERMHEHRVASHDATNGMLIAIAIKKYGWDAFEVSVIEECETEEELLIAEVRHISALRTYVHDLNSHGYNLTRGGEGVRGMKHSVETRAHFSEMRRGENNVNWGGLSDEHKRHISEGRKGKGTGPRPKSRGWHHTSEAKAKIGVASALHKRKSVAQYDGSGTILLRVFASLNDAASYVDGHVHKVADVAHGRRRTHKGFVWRFVNENGHTGDGN